MRSLLGRHVRWLVATAVFLGVTASERAYAQDGCSPDPDPASIASLGMGTVAAAVSDGALNANPLDGVTYFSFVNAATSVNEIVAVWNVTKPNLSGVGNEHVAGAIWWRLTMPSQIVGQIAVVPLGVTGVGSITLFVSTADGRVRRWNVPSKIPTAPAPALPTWTADTRRGSCPTDSLASGPAVALKAYGTGLTKNLVLITTRYGCGTTLENRTLAYDADGVSSNPLPFWSSPLGLSLDYGAQPCSVLYDTRAGSATLGTPTIICAYHEPIGAAQPTVVAYAMTTGALKWQRNMGAVLASPIPYPNDGPTGELWKGYVATYAGSIKQFDLATGNVEFTMPISTAGLAEPPMFIQVNAGGYKHLAVFKDLGGWAHAITAMDGMLSRPWNAFKPSGVKVTGVTLDPHRGRLYVGREDGRLDQFFAHNAGTTPNAPESYFNLSQGATGVTAPVRNPTVGFESTDISAGANRLHVSAQGATGAKGMTLCAPLGSGASVEGGTARQGGGGADTGGGGGGIAADANAAPPKIVNKGIGCDPHAANPIANCAFLTDPINSPCIQTTCSGVDVAGYKGISPILDGEIGVPGTSFNTLNSGVCTPTAKPDGTTCTPPPGSCFTRGACIAGTCALQKEDIAKPAINQCSCTASSLTGALGCAQGLSCVNGTGCVNLNSSMGHCGAPDSSCAPGYECIDGVCREGSCQGIANAPDLDKLIQQELLWSPTAINLVRNYGENTCRVAVGLGPTRSNDAALAIYNPADDNVSIFGILGNNPVTSIDTEATGDIVLTSFASGLPTGSNSHLGGVQIVVGGDEVREVEYVNTVRNGPWTNPRYNSGPLVAIKTMPLMNGRTSFITYVANSIVNGDVLAYEMRWDPMIQAYAVNFLATVLTLPKGVTGIDYTQVKMLATVGGRQTEHLEQFLWITTDDGKLYRYCSEATTWERDSESHAICTFPGLQEFDTSQFFKVCDPGKGCGEDAENPRPVTFYPGRASEGEYIVPVRFDNGMLVLGIANATASSFRPFDERLTALGQNVIGELESEISVGVHGSHVITVAVDGGTPGQLFNIYNFRPW